MPSRSTKRPFLALATALLTFAAASIACSSSKESQTSSDAGPDSSTSDAPSDAGASSGQLDLQDGESAPFEGGCPTCGHP